MFRHILNKFNVNNIEELRGLIFSKLKKAETPDSYVEDIIEGKEFNPRQLDFFNLLEKVRLGDLLPYEWYDPETGIYQTERNHGFIFNCGTVIGYKDNLDEQLRGLFNIGLPDGTGMQTLLIASSELEDKFAAYQSIHKSELQKKIAESRCDFYRTGLKKTLTDGFKLPVRDFKLIISFSFDGLYTDARRNALISLSKSISSTLGSTYINNSLLPPEQLINLLREILCTSTKPVEKVKYDSTRAIRDQVADIDNNIFIAPDGLCINDIGVKSMAVSRYPDTFSLGQCCDFIGNAIDSSSQISFPFIICQNVTFLNISTENGKLAAAAANTAQQVKPGKFTAMFPIFHKKHAEFQLMQQVISNGEGLMLMSHMIHVFHPLGSGESAFTEIKSLYKSFGWNIITNTNLQLPALFYSLPLNHDFAASKDQKKLRMMNLYTQTNVVNTAPIFGDHKGTSGNPILQLLSLRGQLAYFDFFKAGTNNNVALSADSGAGKSFLMNEIARANRAVNAKVSIIDVGRSYKDTCEVFDGQYIEFTKEANICINPFSFMKFKFGLDENTPDSEIDGLIDLDFSSISKEKILGSEDLDDQLTMLKSIFLVSAGIGDDDPNNILADSYFEQAIISSLQKYQTNSTYTTVYTELIEMSVQENNEFPKRLADSIKSYTTSGIFGRYFEGQSSLDINNDFVVLELEELESKGNLKFIVLMIIMLKITQDMYLGSREITKICIIDEAWSLMDGGNTGRFIVTAYRRARKYRGSIMTITQRIDDYAMNSTTLACWSNAAIKISLQQSPPAVIEYDDYKKKIIGRLKSIPGVYSELYIDSLAVNAVFRFVPDDFTKMLFSTSAEDIVLLKKFKEQLNLDTTKAVILLFEVRNAYIKKFNRPNVEVTNDLLNFLNHTESNGFMPNNVHSLIERVKP